MKNSGDILNSIIDTTQMGQSGIKSVLDRPMNPALYQELVSQMQEYAQIESGARRLLQDRKLPAKKGSTSPIPGANGRGIPHFSHVFAPGSLSNPHAGQCPGMARGRTIPLHFPHPTQA